MHIAGEFKAVWFKDPDGNILNLINETMPSPGRATRARSEPPSGAGLRGRSSLFAVGIRLAFETRGFDHNNVDLVTCNITRASDGQLFFVMEGFTPAN